MGKKSSTAVDGGTEARLLQDCLYGACNDVVTIPAEQLAGAKEQGLCDDHPDSVAYAKSLPQNSGNDTDPVA